MPVPSFSTKGANGFAAVPLFTFGSAAPPKPDAPLAPPKGVTELFCGVPKAEPKGFDAPPKSPPPEAALPNPPAAPLLLALLLLLPNGDSVLLFWAPPKMLLFVSPKADVVLEPKAEEPELAVFPNTPPGADPNAPPVLVLAAPRTLLLLDWPNAEVVLDRPNGEALVFEAPPKGDVEAALVEPLKPPNPEVVLPNIRCFVSYEESFCSFF